MQLHYQYLILIFALLVVPLALQRLKIPGAVTCFLAGVICTLGFNLFENDPTIRLLSTFGIVSMFLFAGLEMDFSLLLHQARVYGWHFLIQLVMIITTSFVSHTFLGLTLRAAMILGMALLTPSAGFILSTLHQLELSHSKQAQIKGVVLTNELATLILAFFVLQTTSLVKISISASVLVGLILLVPLALKVFARLISPYAPKSEFALLVIIALISSSITRQLGVYYLLGAFIVGVTAQRFRSNLPSLSSEEMLHAVEMFSTLFIPFYFFFAGSHIHREDIGWLGVLYGLVFLLIALPLRWLQILFVRCVVLRQPFKTGSQIGVQLLPTLVFTLVFANLLKEQFSLPPSLFGGLAIYAVGSSIAPLILRIPLKTIPKQDHS